MIKKGDLVMGISTGKLGMVKHVFIGTGQVQVREKPNVTCTYDSEKQLQVLFTLICKGCDILRDKPHECCAKEITRHDKRHKSNSCFICRNIDFCKDRQKETGCDLYDGSCQTCTLECPYTEN